MTDKVSAEARSRMMAAVKNKHTGIEREVRRQLFALGYRYRVHRRDLPGAPDIVFPRYMVAVFVHGCFWHGHDCPRGRRPASNIDFWNKKLDLNLERDGRNQSALAAAGWRAFVIWECSLQPGLKKSSVTWPALLNEPALHDDRVHKITGEKLGEFRRHCISNHPCERLDLIFWIKNIVCGEGLKNGRFTN
jgi:DNA mismatch endonuclease (patch repair protein)